MPAVIEHFLIKSAWGWCMEKGKLFPNNTYHCQRENKVHYTNEIHKITTTIYNNNVMCAYMHIHIMHYVLYQSYTFFHCLHNKWSTVVCCIQMSVDVLWSDIIRGMFTRLLRSTIGPPAEAMQRCHILHCMMEHTIYKHDRTRVVNRRALCLLKDSLSMQKSIDPLSIL